MDAPRLHPASGRSVAVFGLGYVGCVTAAGLARLGHRVIGVDRDEYKVRCVLDGRAPFFEPGLEALVGHMVKAERLWATASARDALKQADMAMICVGTPSARNGDLDLDQLRRVSMEISEALTDCPRSATPFPIAVRSTAFPGTADEVVIPMLARVDATVLAHPEFLREGSALDDFMKPSLLVVGGADTAAAREVADLYRALDVEACLVSLRTAEVIKYACNLFHAIKIGFANEIGTVCAGLGIAADDVMDTFCRDLTLNISAAYLKPGFAFGGSCLPKDLRALAYRATRMDLELPLINAVLPSNERHLRRAIQAVLDLPVERLGIFGLSFKENTDDLRESPVVPMLEELIGKGRAVRVFDPHIQLEGIYGSNRQFVVAAVPHIGKLLDSSLEETLRWAQHLVITQKPTPRYVDLIQQSELPVLDLTVPGSRSSDASGRT